MKIIKPSIEFLWMTENPLKEIEKAGRICYKSESKIVEGSAEKLVTILIKRGHEAMIEHSSFSYRVVCDRGISHEIVRHRLFSFAQESTRYCNYGKLGIKFIDPVDFELTSDDIAKLEADEIYYNKCLKQGRSPQQARYFLPHGLKTEIVITGNIREWRNFFKLRCAPDAHPQMQEIANMILADVKERIPIVFNEYWGTK